MLDPKLKKSLTDLTSELRSLFASKSDVDHINTLYDTTTTSECNKLVNRETVQDMINQGSASMLGANDLSVSSVTTSGDISCGGTISSTGKLTANGVNVSDVVTKPVSEPSNNVLSAEMFNNIGTLSENRTVSIPSTSGLAPEYNGQFVVPSNSSYKVTFSDVTMVGDTAQKPGTYQFSICNGYGVLVKVA